MANLFRDHHLVQAFNPLAIHRVNHLEDPVERRRTAPALSLFASHHLSRQNSRLHNHQLDQLSNRQAFHQFNHQCIPVTSLLASQLQSHHPIRQDNQVQLHHKFPVLYLHQYPQYILLINSAKNRRYNQLLLLRHIRL